MTTPDPDSWTVEITHPETGRVRNPTVLDVYDAGDDSTVATTDLNTRSEVDASAAEGADLYFKVAHTGTSDVNATFTVEGSVE